ncbi:hypothetical protein B0A50_06959 [Salinomyces thailandicus]|uniref:ferric-chelate reductase (NADPH) n=1 Tax=Salinomyces thailandicus TaxID=706561 RepID=A0A4U0TPS6_9PEZI|nr:hypothetical protein B0A50_06959 [Salinomyces thailandica]
MDRPSETRRRGFFETGFDGLEAFRRRWLLMDSPGRWLFGRVSRLQVLILAVLTGYLLVFSFVGLTYQTWITPIEGTNLHNTRGTWGCWADRVGALAYALTPFSVLLAQRESLLSLITGIPHQHFNFLHRWLGYIIFAQAFFHTLGWTLVEGYFYRPQPATFAEWLSQMYAIFGVVAMFLLTLMLVLSTQTCIRWLGYEVFKISHWVLAVLYIAACWGHWDKLWCWMVASLALICLDQLVRAFRTLYIHFGGQSTSDTGFTCPQAHVSLFGEPDDLVARLDFDYNHKAPWYAGQHFHLCFPTLSLWQSHPFTPASLPNLHTKCQHHSYLIRVRQGQTAQLAASASSPGHAPCIPTLLTGPYGRALPSFSFQNVLAIAGGTGVSFTLPIILEALRQQGPSKASALEFVWIVRRSRDLLWLGEELAALKTKLKQNANFRIKIFVTREVDGLRVGLGEKGTPGSSSLSSSASSAAAGDDEMKRLEQLLCETPRFSVMWLGDRHPDSSEVLEEFYERVGLSGGGKVEVLGSGPEGLSGDLRARVSRWKATRGEKVEFYWDSRA